MTSNSSSNRKNEISKSEIQVLFTLIDQSFLSNSKISRILRKYPSATVRDLISLKNKTLVRQNNEQEYSITEKGLDEINKKKYQTAFYEELQEHIKRLKENPEKKGWTPKDLDLGGLTNAQCRLLYLLKHDEYFANVEIAKILDRHDSDTYDGLQFLVKENLIEKNQDSKYSITDDGLQRIEKNVSKNTICKLELQFVTHLKARPELRKSIVVVVVGLTSIGWIESNLAHAVTTYAAAPIKSATTAPVITTTTGTATTSILTTKTVMASILATIIVTGGIVGPYTLDPNIFGNSFPDDINITNGNNDSSTSQKLSNSELSSHSNSNTGTNKSAKSSVSSNAPSSATTSQSPQSASQENSLETTNDSQTTTGSSGSSSPSNPTTSIPSVTPLSQLFAKNAISASTTDIKVDKSDNMWIADRDNNQVRKLNSQGETVLVIGGTTQDKVTITRTTASHFDTISQNIQLLVMPYVYADGSSITLNKPTRLAIDNSPVGDTVYVYIVDSGNKRILKVDDNGNHIPEFRFDCNGTDSTQNKLCENYDNSEIFNLNIVTSTDGNYLYITTGNTNSNAKGLSSNFHAFDSVTGSLAESENSNLNLTNAVTRDQYIYALDDVVGAIIKFNSNEIIDIPLKDKDNNFLLPFSFTVDKSEQFIYVFDLFGILYKYDIDGTLLDSQKYDGFIAGMDIDSDGNILALDVINEQIATISFEDAIATFSEKFDDIMCNTDSMINDPISVPPEVTAALPISELLPRANSLAFDTQQYKEGLLFYYITSQIQPTNVNAWNGIGYTQTQICSNDSAEIAYTQALSIDSNNINAKIGLADFTINQVVREGNSSILKLEDVELQLQSVLDLDPRNTNALNALGYIETLREDYNTAIDYYQDSLKIDSKKTTTLNGLAFSHLRSDNLGEATTTYLKTINVDPNNFDALVGLITTYTQQGFPELAESFIDKLDESNSIIADKLIEQGNWLKQNGQTQEAQRLFDAAEKLQS